VLNIKDGAENFFPHQDGLNSVVAVTDADGERVASYNYEAFGTIKDATGVLDNNITYTGRWIEPETGDYFYRARYYDSGIGRFLKRDPIGFESGDYNFYRYVGNNPNSWIDPYGFDVIGPVFNRTPKKKEFKLDPYSKKHTHRNLNNRCPKNIPEKCEANNKYYDQKGNEWKKDNPISSAIFHGGLFGFKTFRGIRKLSGSQCTYTKDGVLVDNGPYMGTFDYGEAPSDEHWDFDVETHNENPHYEPNLTEQY
jgi:RHS repeat-associated protein